MHRFIPLFPSTAPQPLRVSIAVQKVPGAASQTILISSSWFARSYLGALVDAGQRVHGWLEIAVQTSGVGSLVDDAEPATNPEYELYWKRWVQASITSLDTILTGQETQNAPALWLDVGEGTAVVPRHSESGEFYTLCRDDARLTAANLPAFSTSRQRFLEVKHRPEAPLVSLSSETPSGTLAVASVLPPGELIPFNPGGGSIFVRYLAPLEWEQHRKLLSGGVFSGLSAGSPAVNLGGPYEQLRDWNALQQSGAYLFSTTRGRAGRFHETFHLKLLVWLSALRAVRDRVRSTQLPQLNLTPSAFRVDLAAQSGALPVLWTARAVLVEPPASMEVPTPGELRYFKRVGNSAFSIYLPAEANRQIRGRGEVRIRRVAPEPDGLKIEATLVASEWVNCTNRDLVWVKLPLADGGVFDLVGKMDTGEALTGGEALFRTAPLLLSPAVQATLRKMEGGVFPGISFSTIPLLSTPVDLYSLGVLGIQLLLGGGTKPLPEAIDEVLSLARKVNEQPPAAAVIRSGAEENKRWLVLLGPHHHGHGVASPDEAAAFFPQELWWDALSTLGRFFPGASSKSFCRDLGDAPAQRLESVFDRAIYDLEALVQRSQSLLLCDWPSNREMVRVIQKSR